LSKAGEGGRGRILLVSVEMGFSVLLVDAMSAAEVFEKKRLREGKKRKVVGNRRQR